MWSSHSSSSWGNGRWQDAPRTPRRRSQSRSRGKGKGQPQGHSGKGKTKGKGKTEEYHGTAGTTPWQSSSSALQSLGVTLPAMEQKVQQTPAPKQVEGVISGLRAHLRSLGQETTPEVESYLAKCLGNGPQVIKQASQRLEASGKTAAKLKVELSQLATQWQKFQKKVEDEYTQQKQKYLEKQKQLQDALVQAEEEYNAAQQALREAAAATETPTGDDVVPPKSTEVTEAEQQLEGTGTPQKRKPEVVDVEEDPVMKRFEVETEQFPEAFDDCLWDETLTSLQYLDRIEHMEMFEATFSGHQHRDVVRQIEGSTLWTLLALGEDLHHPGSIEWYGATPQQGPFAHFADEDMANLHESLGTDCSFAADIIRRVASNGNGRIDFVSYGYFGRYRGQRVVTIQLSQLATWRHRVQEIWADFEDQSTIRLHIADPMPLDEVLSIHVVARSHLADANHHFLLMDKIEESPQAESRFVIEVSQQPNGFELLLTSGINLNTVTARTILKHGPGIWQHHRHLPVSDGQYWKILAEDEMDQVYMMQIRLVTPHIGPKPILDSSDHPLEASSHHPHVIDRWCDGGRELPVIDHSSFMQQPPSVATTDDVEDYHLFYRESGHTNLHIADSAAHDFSTLVENHLNLPTEGSSSIRTFHMVLHPPQLELSNYNVHILEFRGDADSRLMNDDVLCLYQLTFMHPDRRADTKDKFKVFWTPHVATRDRILFHLRAVDPCRTRVCTLYVNNEVWSELDTTIRHFKDGDFIALYVTAARESSVIATRCDFQGYEATERQRRVFINSTSSESEVEENPTPTTERSRSRTSRRFNEEPEGEPEHRPQVDDDPSLMQLTSPGSRLDSPLDFEIQSISLFQEVCLLSPEDPCQQWTIISYGLHRTHQGMRSAKIHEMEETTLRQALKDVWEDVPLGATLHFISPNPDVGPCVHVIVEFTDDTTQLPEGIPVLRRIFHDDQLTIEAAYHSDAARASDLYHQADLQDICDHSECQIWLNHVWLRETLPFRLRQGALLDIRIDSRPQGHANVDAEVDSQSLLQTKITTRSRRQPIYLASHLPTTLVVSCNFQKVLEANQILTSLPWLLMDFSEVAMPDTALHALAPLFPSWTGEPPISYHIYTDGSFSKRTPDHGGCGIVLCVNTESGPQCVGVMSRTCIPTAKSHSAESIAMLWATIVALQVSDFHQQAYPGLPFMFEFGFDADVTGHQAAGHWTSFKHPDMQRMSRC
eukprot:symbB.v1.2.000131.t2/scaffold16.1/size461936/5